MEEEWRRRGKKTGEEDRRSGREERRGKKIGGMVEEEGRTSVVEVTLHSILVFVCVVHTPVLALLP